MQSENSFSNFAEAKPIFERSSKIAMQLVCSAKVGCDFAIEKSKINRISNRKTKHLGNLLTKVKERK